MQDAIKPHLMRHVVLATPDLDTLSGTLQAFLKIAPGFRNDMGAILGFRNEMMMIGSTMVELVQPVKPDHRLNHWFAENGGGGGYMIVFQTFDADAFRARAAAEKLRLTRDMLFRGQDLIQFEPARFGTHLETYRYSLPNGWWGDPVGRDYPRSGTASGIVGADVAVEAPPAEIAAQVGRLFQSPVDGARVRLVDKTIRFVPASGRRGLIAIDLTAIDPATRGHKATIGAVEWRLV
ncbi:VOC family protein [Sphingomonas sp.]|uniref:VOC family protein n=1 Tax=Sphingomonas sp. TaxID=28214 RepID=UPI002C7C5505|nr:VOC family protein [Sphingomonas sp.]HWK34858.1 VOC family protein [Sphingomonas sp.]